MEKKQANDRYRENEEARRKIFEEEMEIENVEHAETIIDHQAIGKREQNKIRPILINYGIKRNSKRDLKNLVRAKRLRYSEHYPRVSISKNRSRKEREREKTEKETKEKVVKKSTTIPFFFKSKAFCVVNEI